MLAKQTPRFPKDRGVFIASKLGSHRLSPTGAGVGVKTLVLDQEGVWLDGDACEAPATRLDAEHLAYATAPWSLRVLVRRRWRALPVALFLAWLTVDGCYALYWSLKDPAVLALMRDVNFPASLSLYGMCGLGWLYQGSLRQAWQAISRSVG